MTTFLSLNFFEFLSTFRGNVYKNVHKNCVMNILMNKMLAVQSCQLSWTKQQKPKITWSKVVSEAEGILSSEKYETGDFVSMDQYVVKTPGRLPSGYGQESNVNMFHGGTIFWGVGSKVIHVENQVRLLPLK